MPVKLTVIVPTYNRANYLARCLHSVLASDYESLEVIVSDNASQDSTPETLRAFSDRRLQYYRNETNIGAERNILKLLQYASGDYVILMTDDAFLNQNGISEILRIIQDHPDVGVILSAKNLIDDKSNEPFSDVPLGTSRLLKAGPESLLALWLVSGFLPGTVIRRDLIDIEGFRRHMSSMSPQLYIAGSAMKRAPAYYTEVQLLTCTVCNKVYWEWPSDFNVGAQIKMAKELWPGLDEKQCRDMLIQQVVSREGRLMVMLRRADGCPSLKKFGQCVLSLLSIPEMRQSRAFWRNSLLCLVGFPLIKLMLVVSELPVIRPAYVKLRRRLGP